MPRVAQYESQIIATPSGAVVAAARRVSGRGGDRDGGGNWKSPGDRGWQDRAWRWYDTIGEFRFACSWVGNVLSRAVLHVHKGDVRVENGDAYDALQALFGGYDGQKEMFRQLGIQFTVAGEGYIVAQDGGTDRTDKWWVVAATELTRAGDDVWKIGKKEVDNPLVIRLWRPHPRSNRAPDSPTRAVLPVLSEIDGLTKHVAAQIDSRLAGAGMLLLPDNISFAGTQTNADGTSSTTDALDPFLEELVQTMMTAIKNREDPSALVPIILQANGEYLDKVRHLTFSTPLDEQALELRKEAIRRLALGMDMPPEVLTGTGDVNHWGAWQIEDASIKAHTEPLLQIILSSLTEGYLWPYLEGAGMDEEEARDFHFVADTSQMRLRPDRSKEALELYDRAVLGPKAVLTENGFDLSEEMSDRERTDFFTRKVASGMTTPDLVSAALSLLGVNLPVEQIVVPETREHPAVDTPSLKEHPEHDPPDPNARRHRRTEEAAMAEVVVVRALERAGNRIKSKYKDKISMGAENVKPHTLHRFTARMTPIEVNDVLLDAWTILGELPPMTTIKAKTLDDYVRYLFTNNLPHESQTFRGFLEDHDE